MPALVTVEDVNAWLAPTKYDLEDLDDDVEDIYQKVVLGRLGQVYDVSGWVSPGTAPALVRKVIAGSVAAHEYERRVSEDVVEGDLYADKIRQWVRQLLDAIYGGEMDIGEDQDPDLSAARSFAFFPTDAQDSDANYARRFVLGLDL